MRVRLISGVFFLLIFVGCRQHIDPAQTKMQINRTLDDWHNAAAAADFDRYFSHFASDSAIFMGTDATEHWTVPEFKKYAKPYFAKGKAWTFTPVRRHVYLSQNGKIGWFDEVLHTPNLGPARGTGILVKQDISWKITHYNLSIPIPNAIADTVVQQVKQALADTSQVKE